MENCFKLPFHFEPMYGVFFLFDKFCKRLFFIFILFQVAVKFRTGNAKIYVFQRKMAADVNAISAYNFNQTRVVRVVSISYSTYFNNDLKKKMFYIYLDFGHDKNIIEWVPFPDKKIVFQFQKMSQIKVHFVQICFNT